jgi:YHS domain-containing protein
MKSVLILIAVFFVVRFLKNSLEAKKEEKAVPAAPPSAKESAGARQKGEEMALDPVCGSYVPVSAAVISTEGGKTVYFCSEDCRGRYAP